MGGSLTLAALAAGTVGGVAQAVVMTPAGMIFTSLNVNRGKPGHENDNALSVTKRIIQEKGIGGMFLGWGPMCARQASNWASRSCFTELARTTFGLSQYGMMGEILSGAVGGIGSCWNTPIETIRVLMHRDVSMGKEAKTFGQYWKDMVAEQGYPGLFRGGTSQMDCYFEFCLKANTLTIALVNHLGRDLLIFQLPLVVSKQSGRQCLWLSYRT